MSFKQTAVLDQVFERAQSLAERQGYAQLTLDHLFWAILDRDHSHAIYLLRRTLQAWELSPMKQRVERELERKAHWLKKGRITSSAPASEKRRNLLLRMSAEVEKHRPPLLNTAHLLMVILRDRRSFGSRLLASRHVRPFVVQEVMADLPPNEDYYEEMRALDEWNSVSKSDRLRQTLDSLRNENPSLSHETSSVKEGAFPSSGEKPAGLSAFGTDLTRAAAEGRLDPVVGREEEIERMVQILGRRKKNNPVLIGEPGVGKSAIVEGLALRIAQRQVPPALYHKRIFSLDLSSLVAGTKYRGQFEERINALVRELSRSKQTILFIDEIHMLVGAGSTQGSLDAANMLKPALARGEIQCIGATTLTEYRQYIEADGALERRFQQILVDPLTADETLEMLRRIKKHYEEHHGVHYTEEALKSCVQLTERYVTGRFFPDKAIDVLDEAGSRAHCQAVGRQYFLSEESRQRSDSSGLLFSKEVESHSTTSLLPEERTHVASKPIKELCDGIRFREADHAVVDARQIREVVSVMTGIPSAQLSQDEKARLKGLYDYFSSVVVGQEEAVRKVTRALQRSRVGLKDPDRPIGVFMFVGPTGVGKTYMAKQLARHFFDSEEALVRVDMSEYAEKHNVSRLVGSPPGYVGYGEGGQLTERVRRRPYCVLLFDEIEKAHPEVFNLMLQIFDEGCLTDGLGQKVDFRHTIIIMTSNVGSREAQRRRHSVGYETRYAERRAEQDREEIYRRNLEQVFAPEFINRIDDVVVFNSLGEKDIRKIVELEFSRLARRVDELGYTIQASEKAKTWLVGKGYEPTYGVRSLKRTLLDWVEEPLAEMIVDGRVNSGDVIDVGCWDDTIRLQVKQSA